MKLPIDEVKKKLTPEQFDVVCHGATEAPGSGKYLHTNDKGMYLCVVCGTELFASDTKFDSGTGWPSFTDPANTEHVELVPDTSMGMMRTEVQCKKCGAHLGHVFDDGPGESGKRYCINSLALNLKKSS